MVQKLRQSDIPGRKMCHNRKTCILSGREERDRNKTFSVHRIRPSVTKEAQEYANRSTSEIIPSAATRPCLRVSLHAFRLFTLPPECIRLQ
jgi:hypothetical protein